MSTIKYAPSNWKVAFEKDSKDHYHTIITALHVEENGDGYQMQLAEVFNFGECTEGHYKLIMAAPAMYEAIQFAIAALAATATAGMIDTGELIADADKARKRLQKAIKSLL